MEEQSEQAKRCVQIALKALLISDTERAKQFMEIAENAHPTLEELGNFIIL